MKRGELTLALGLTISPATITHIAACPEVDPVGCATAPIEDHIHDVSITFGSVTLAGTVGIGWNLAARLELPFDMKRRRVRYTTLAGAPFVPPYSDLHHSNSTLSGVGDPTLALEWNKQLGHALRVGFSGGVRIPLGATTENTAPLAAQSLEHEHMQIGNGTVDPVIAATGSWTRGKWAVFGRLDARLPLYESDAGYRGAPQIDLVLGPGYRFRAHTLAFVQVGLSHSGEERWDGQPNEVSGRDVLRLVVGGSFGLGHRLRIGPVVQIELANTAVGGTFRQPVIGTLTFTYGNISAVEREPR